MQIKMRKCRSLISLITRNNISIINVLIYVMIVDIVKVKVSVLDRFKPECLGARGSEDGWDTMPQAALFPWGLLRL
jgi:hypothetical protein